jgi:AcrR family transcriptional regulator
MMIDVEAVAEGQRTGRPRDARVDEAVRRAVIEVLAECGYSGFTVEKVAAAAGCGKATVYRRWPSREHLILAMFDQIQMEYPQPDTGTLRGDLLEVTAHIARVAADPVKRQAMAHLITASKLDPELRRRFQSFTQLREATCHRIVRQARRRGELRSGLDETVVADMIVAGLFLRIMVADTPIDRRYVEKCVDVLVNGLVDR